MDESQNTGGSGGDSGGLPIRKLSPRQLRAVNLLAQGEPVYKVAQELKVHRVTVERWKQIPEFDAALTSQSLARDESICARSAQLANASLATLEELLHGAENEADRIRAASAVLSFFAKTRN